MRIAIGSDHAGFALKEVLKAHLASQNYELVDSGAHNLEKSDYPDFAKKVAGLIHNEKAELGILVCGSGIGMCITANRFARVRAAVIRNDDDAMLSRLHNNANLACFGERLTSAEEATRLLDLFMATKFEAGRHEKRVEKIDK